MPCWGENGKVSYSNVLVLNNLLISGFKAYPNPTQDVLNVRIPLGANREMKLIVTDGSGRTLLSKVVRVMKGESTLQLNVSHFKSGIYYLKLACTNGCENAVIKFEKK